MLHTAEEEEALVPLVRNRRHRARAPLPPAADKEQAIEVPGDVKTSSSCGRGVSARVRDLFHVRDGSSRQLYLMISLEVSIVICNKSLFHSDSYLPAGVVADCLLCSPPLVLSLPLLVSLSGEIVLLLTS